MRISERVYLVGSEQFGLSHPLDCSCYLLDGGSGLALIDAGLGLGVDDIITNIRSAGFQPEQLTDILITHAHAGHWGGAHDIRRLTKARIWVHELGADAMADITNDRGIQLNMLHQRYPAGFTPSAVAADRTFRDGDIIRVGNLEIRAILVQGHTKDSTCFQFRDGDKTGLITGDVVFYGGRLGLLNLDGFSMDDYRRDIQKLAGLGVDMLLPGHGVFMLRRGQIHIDRAIEKLGDFVMPETFFETNELMWSKDYLHRMSGGQ